ncbi:T9SS type B sorting domain-containing protein [Pedobacter hiemivivus]|uniref:T9SS type B sorting domain-containing protein n=1 Tax=Pedobacter hiemivivus TaxID=2530454 RepID=A0A4U1GAY2_9SPHI|nr:putative Ig domain-containing protein [Pedobacter hiemivivus]TKC60030.1 T9SS type B sorting domain-containing protein [Pedobacter hiemivivus]
MKRTSTLFNLLKKYLFFVSFLSITLITSKSYSQTRIYADNVVASPNAQSSVVGCGFLGLGPCFNAVTVTNPDNAKNNSETSFARVNSTAGVALDIGAYQGELELKFPTTVAAGKTAYIRINVNNPDLLNSLLGGSLGNLLADVVGTVVLGDRYFQAGARMGTGSGNNVISANSSNPFATDNVKIIKDVNGYFYIAITPQMPYDRVYVKDFTKAILGLGASSYTDVYYAFHGEGTDPCAQGFATSFEGSGITLDALKLGQAGVTNMERVIDADKTNFSQLSLGVVGLGSEVSQVIYFETLSKTTDEFNVKIQADKALLDVGLSNNIKLTAYKGSTSVYENNLNTTLNLDLLGLLKTGVPVPIPFAPGVEFDRVKVTFSSFAAVGLTQTFKLYSVTRSAARPTFVDPASNAVTACYGTAANLKATTLPTNELRWYDDPIAGNLLTPNADGSYTTPALTASKTYYVAARTIGCTEESVRVPVVVTVNPQVNFVTTVLSNATLTTPYFKQITAATGGTPAFTYALAQGSTPLPAGLTLATNGAIGGTPTASGVFPFSITATDSKGCVAIAAFSLTVNVALSIDTKLLPNGTVDIPYPPQTIPAATGGTGPYTYAAPVGSLPPGLNFDPLTRVISGTPTVKGTYEIPVTVTDVNGNTIIQKYTIVVRDPLVLATVPLSNGTVNVVYPTQTIPSATGGSGAYTYSITTGVLPTGLTFDPITREIKGTPTSQAGTYPIQITVADTEGKTTIANYSILVKDPLLLLTKSLPDGTVGVAYATQTLTGATGGVGPYTYLGSNFPPGLTFNPATLQVSGTPTASGSYIATVKVTDADGTVANQTYTIKVNGELTLPSAILPNGLVGTVYPTQVLPAVSGGTSPYTYTAIGTPPGVNFDPVTREIKGTPLSGGTFTVTVTAKDINNLSTTTDYTIVVGVSAPIVNGVTTCSGTPATLSVSSPQTGVNYNWYGPTGNTPLFTGTTYTTGPLNSSTTFYVEAVSGTAVSSRTAVNVTINAAPDPATVITANENISTGQTATLLVSSTGGSIVKWYTAATGGAAFFTGTTYTTPALAATTSYFVETESALGCVSATRSEVKVTVTNLPVNAKCNAATSQQSGVDGICLLCGVVDPGASTDADPNTFTKINLVVGAGASGYQRLIFAAPGTATDSVRLDIATPVGLTDVAVLGNITITLFNGNTMVGTAHALNETQISLQLLTGNRFKATFVAGGVYDRVEIRFGALVSALSNLSIYGAEIVYPNPTVSATGRTICAGSATTLNATANGGTTLKWFASSSGGTALATGATFTTPTILTVNTTFYIEVSKNGCANTDRVPVTVIVTTPPDAPVLANSDAVCAGSAAVLSVSNPLVGATYKWYTLEVGGTPVFEGPVFNAGILNATTTYYVEAAIGSCSSATRTMAVVTVNPLPALPQVQASATTVSPGQTAILNASSPEANIIFHWYSSATNTTPLHTGPTYVTAPLMVTTTYYLEAASTVTGCAASSRVQVTIDVDNNGLPNPVPCEGAVTQTNGVDGLGLLAGVFNPELAVDADTKTGSSLVLPVGLLGGSVYQRAAFTGLSHTGDTVRVQLSTPGKLLSLGLLGGITLTTYNNGVSNNDPLLLTNNLVDMQLLSGNTEALLTFVPATPFDQVEVRLNAGVATALTTVDLNYAQRITKAPEVASANVAGCATQPLALSVLNPQVGLTYKWYDGTGALVFTGNPYNTPNLTVNTKYYVSAANASGCESYKTLINISVNPKPATPELETPIVNTCAGNTVILKVKNPITGLTYKWYNSTNTYLAQDGTSLTIPAVLATTTYSVEAVNSCNVASDRATATINVGSLDIPVITPPSVTVRVGVQAVLTATSSTAGVTFKWYDTPGGLIPLFTGPTFIADAQLVAGSKTYYVEATAPSGCSAPTRALVTVTAFDGPVSPVPCEGASAQTKGTTGIVLLTDVYNSGLAIDQDAATASSLVIPVGLAGSVYQRLGFNGLSNVGDTVRVLLTSPSKILSLAILPSLELTSYNNGTSNGDATVISNSSINLQLLSNGSQALLTFVPTLPFDAIEVKLNSGLLGAFTSIDVNYAQRIMIAPNVLAPTAAACQGSAAVLSVTNPQPNVTYKWYQGTTFMADGNTYSTPTTLTAGTYDFFVTAARNGCESKRVKVVVTILPLPLTPVADVLSPVTTCINTPVTLSVQAVNGVAFNWFDAAVGGNQLVANNKDYLSSANLAVGTYDYFVEAVNANSCTNSARLKITLIVRPNALAADIIVSDQTICSGNTAILVATAPTITGATFKWYKDPALKDVPFDGASFTTDALTVTTKYYVIVNGPNTCANDASSAKIVTVTVNKNSVASDIVVADKAICAGSTATLNAASTTVTTPVFRWYKTQALTDVPFVGASFTTDALTTTTKYYVTVSGDGTCANTAASAKIVTVTVNRNATEADIIAADRATCSGTAVVLTVTSAINNPVFSWYRNAALTDLAVRSSTFTTPALTATTKYYVTVSGTDVCANDPANAKVVTVTVNRNGIASDITLADKTICSGTTAILNASSAVLLPVFKWYRDASLTDLAFEGPTFTTPALTLTAKYYVTVSGTGVCANDMASAKVVTVTVTRNGEVKDIISADQTICSGQTASLTVSSGTVNNAVFTWYRDAELTDVAFRGANVTTPILTTTSRYYVTVSGDGVCENVPGSAKMVTVTVNPVPNVPIIGPASPTACSGDAVILTVQNPQAGVTYEWYTAASNGTLLHTGISYTTDPLNGNVDYYLKATNASNCGSVNGMVKITVVVTNRPQAPSVPLGTVNTCIGSGATLSVSNAVAGVTYNWYATALSTTILGSGTTFTTLPATATTTTYYVEAKSGNCTSSSRTPVVVNAGALPNPPATVSGAGSPVCPGSTTVLTVNNPDPAVKYAWFNVQTGGASLAEGNSFTVPALSATTTYYVGSINLLSGCSSSTRTAVTITVLTKLAAPVVSVQAATATSINFAWIAVPGATAYEVSTDAGLTWTAPSSGPAGTSHLIAGLNPDQQVMIRVRAKGQLDCQLSDATTFTGKAENPLGNEIFIPNTFTPNNDGKNDILYVYGNTIAKLKLRVYNQWGQFLYESLSIQNGWDGTYRGTLQPNGVYVYYLDADFNDGTKATKKGTITLLR